MKAKKKYYDGAYNKFMIKPQKRCKIQQKMEENKNGFTTVKNKDEDDDDDNQEIANGRKFIAHI